VRCLAWPIAFSTLFLASCTRPSADVVRHAAQEAPALSALPERVERPAVPAEPVPAEPAPEPEPALPSGLEVGKLVSLEVPGEPDVVVAQASAQAHGVVLYLHGACGDVRAPKAWLDEIEGRGTLISIRGDRSCGKGGRYYWGPDTRVLEQRIEHAIDRVAELRGDLFDPTDRVLMGYSQGATRAQELARAYPERYPLVILAGIPVAPSARHLVHARAVVVLGGEHELKTHMRTGVWALEAHHVPVRFDVFPGAKHGEFGPEGARVMRGAFDWLSGYEPTTPTP
jgi:predicted esterase